MKKTTEEHFWTKVNKDGPVVVRDGAWPIAAPAPPRTKCWLWTACLAANKYGHFWDGKRQQMIVAHLWLWEQENGPVPDGLQLDHRCRIYHCVRPSHLEPVTAQVNAQRSLTYLNGQHEREKTHCPQGHPYDEKNTMHKANNKRVCKTCAYARRHAWWERKSQDPKFLVQKNTTERQRYAAAKETS